MYGPPICLNCNSNAEQRKRGLCKSCYQRKNVRLKFPAMKLGRPRKHVVEREAIAGAVNSEDFDTEKVLPDDDSSTDAVPGSEAKMRVMEDRAARGRCVFHPGDLTFALMKCLELD